MSRDAAWLPSEIADQLSELRAWVRWQWLLRGAGRVGAIASLGLVAAFAADYRYDLAPATRVAVLSSLGTLTVLAFLVWIVVPLCRRIGWAELAAMADKSHPHWEGALTSAVELFDPQQPDAFKGSPVMRDMLLQQTQKRINELDLEEVVSSRKAWSSVRWGLASCLLLAIPVFLAPSAYRQLWQRFLMPWGNWGTAGLWQIDVANGDRIVARGADVELLATAERSGQTEPPKSLTLEWRDSVGTTDHRAMPFDEARKAFVALVPHVMRDLDYRIVIERQKSRNYKIQVVEPPVVTKVRLDVDPPAYAGWPAQSLDGAIGSMRVFERSQLKFTLEFNKPVETAQLLWREHGGANSKLQLAESKQSASLELTADPAVAGQFQFVLEDIHKLANNDTVPRELVVVTDEAPTLTVKGDHSTEARPNDVIPIDVAASDDIGLGTMELHVVIEDKPREPVAVEAVRGEKNFEHRFTLDLSQLQVEHGQWLNYRVRITDQRQEPGPHEVWSDPRVLRISSKAAPPGANELAKSHEQLREELKDLRHDIAAKGTEIQKFRQEAAAPNRPASNDTDAERVAKLQQQLHELTQRAEQLAAQLERDPLFHELGEQAEQVARNELANAEAEVQQSHGEPDQKLNREQLDHLQQAEQELDRATKQLAQLERPFDQLAELQKDLLELRRLARQAEQLANRTDELAKADTNKHDAPASDPNQPEAQARDEKQAAAEAAQQAAEQQQLAEQQKQLADALEDLLKRRPELLNAARRDQLEQLAQLAEEAKQLAEQQQALADALREQQEAAADRNAELAAKQDELQQAKPNQPTVAQAARELAKEQAQLAAKTAESAKAEDSVERQQAAEQLQREQAALNDRVENLPIANPPDADPADPAMPNPAQAARQAAEQRGAKAEQALAEGNLEQAAQEQRRAEQALRELAQQAAQQAAQQPLPEPQADVANPEDNEPVFTFEVFDAFGRALDVRSYERESRFDEPLFRNSVLANYQYGLTRFSTVVDQLPVINWYSVGSRPRNDQDSASVVSLQFSESAGDGFRIRVTRLSAEQQNAVAYFLFGRELKTVNRLTFPVATLSQNVEPSAKELPGNLLRLRGWVDQLVKETDGSETQIAARLRDELRIHGGFRYLQRHVVEQALEKPRNVEDFLFDERFKRGHCEYFADALTLMLRSAGIPARTVAGFRGGEYQNRGPKQSPGYYLVRKKDAHAWVEAFVNGNWVILDGTPGAGRVGANQDGGQEVAQLAVDTQSVQRELARQAQELQRQVQQELGRDAPETQQAQQAAQQAQASQQRSDNGQFPQAAQRGEQAAEAAEQLAEQLQNNPRANPELAQQANELAERQQAVAQQMEQLGQQPQAANAAQQQRQQELNNAAQQLGQQLAEAQQRLGQQPLNQPQAAQGAQQAGEQTANSQQNMQAAQQQAQQGNANQAAQSAEQAAENLQQAAQQAQSASERNAPPQSPIPRGVGQEVAQAAEQLRQAAQAQQAANEQAQTPQNGPPMPGNPSGQQPRQPSSSQQASAAGQQPASGQGQQGQSGQGQGQSGQVQSRGQTGQGQAQGQGQGQSAQSGQGQSSGQGQQGQSQGQGQGQSQGQGRGQGQAPGQGQGAPMPADGQSADAPLAQAARQLRAAARALSDAANQSAPLPSQGGQPQSGEPSNDPNGSQNIAQAGGGGNGQGNVEQDRGENLGDLAAQVRKMTGRNWGQLSSKLKTELSQQAKHQAHGDYSKLIKLYFQEIAKTQPDVAAGGKP